MCPLSTHVKLLRVSCAKKCSIKSSVVVVVVVDAWRTLLPSGCQIDIKLYTLLSFRCCDAPLPAGEGSRRHVCVVWAWHWHWQKPCLFTAGNNCCCTLPVAVASQSGAHTSHVARLHLLCKLLIFFNNRETVDDEWLGRGCGAAVAELRPRNMLDGCAPK